MCQQEQSARLFEGHVREVTFLEDEVVSVRDSLVVGEKAKIETWKTDERVTKDLKATLGLQ